MKVLNCLSKKKRKKKRNRVCPRALTQFNIQGRGKAKGKGKGKGPLARLESFVYCILIKENS